MQPTVLITGAAKRIGRALAVHLASMGYHIAAHYHSSHNDAESLVSEIHSLGRKCTLFKADLSVPADVEHLIESVIDQCDGLELLINNASIFEKFSIKDTDYSILERNFMINCFAPILLTRNFAKNVDKGQIINILDTKIIGNASGYCAYTLSKKTLAEFTRMAALEFAPSIRVNAIAPGIILPPPDKGEQYLDPLIEKVPLKEKGSLNDICKTADFLIQNTYLTGQTIFVDGGKHLIQ